MKNLKNLVPILVLLLHVRELHAAPTITSFLVGPRPAQGRVGEPLLISVSGLALPVDVFFSNGTNPVVEAATVVVDVARGVVVTRVPVGAATGYMKVTAAGVDSAPYFFRVDPSPFVPGTNVVSGQVTDGVAPVDGTIVFSLLGAGGCGSSGTEVEDFTTVSGGTYALHGGDGEHFVLAFPPDGVALGATGSPVTLSSTPSTLDVILPASALVTGTLVDANDSTPVPYGRISLDSASGDAHDETYADASGSFAARLHAGDWQYRTGPAPGDAHAETEGMFTVAGDMDLGNIGLATGVRISGTITRQADGSPVAGAEVRAFVGTPCCSEGDKKLSAGDGSYVLVVSGGATYDLVAEFEGRTTLANTRVEGVAVDMADLVEDIEAPDAAFITGTATDDMGQPVPCLRIQGQTAGMGNEAFIGATTAADGTYRMRAAPDANGYLVTTGDQEDNSPPYAAQTWNGTPAGTYFWCEGTPVTASTAGQTTSGIDFVLPHAAAITGQISTQVGGCTDDLGSFKVTVDDGSGGHMCSMGNTESSYGPPGYRIGMLPPSALFTSGLRACLRLEGYDPQCWNAELAPAFDTITVTAGNTTAGVDFCLATCASPVMWFRDADGDGFGKSDVTERSCTQPTGYVDQSGDCNDGDAAVNPSAPEICNQVDDDCDGQVNEGNPGGGAGCATGQPGVCAAGTTTCQGGSLVCVQNTSPSQETCNNLDDDCDGTVDGFATSCGEGACARTGTCTAGVED